MATIVCKREGCPRFHMKMTPIDEHPEHVLFLCPFEGAGLKPRGCGATRIIHKSICGGTIGGGRTRTDGRREAIGVGAPWKE